MVGNAGFLIAASTSVICLAVASLASRAVLPWLDTPTADRCHVGHRRHRSLANDRHQPLGGLQRQRRQDGSDEE